MIPENMTVKDFEDCCEFIEDQLIVGWVLDGTINSLGTASLVTH